jgi:hypothetical protein
MNRILILQCSIDLPFFKGVEKTIDECGETINRENHFFNQKIQTLSFANIDGLKLKITWEAKRM